MFYVSIDKFLAEYFQRKVIPMYKILELNPQLAPFAGDIDLRMFLYRATKGRLLSEGQTLNDFANAYNYYGFHRTETGWVYREWAPSAYQLYL